MSLQTDQTLGTYRIRAPLGVGGMGEVWRAEDTTLGREEIYIETFPEPIDRWRVSSDGGFGPLWRRDGQELFFHNPQLHLIAVPVDLAGNGSSIEIGTSEVLFTADFKDGADRQPYDTIDGRVFVINRTVANEDNRPTTLVVNALPPTKR